MATSLASPAASVAGTGAAPGGAPSPSAYPDISLGTSTGAEDAGGGASAEPVAGASPDGGQPKAGSEPGKSGTTDDGLDADGRAVPAKWREAFKNDPELKALFFERRAFQKEFPEGIVGVRALKETLDLAGGEAGLHQLQTDLGDFRQLANQFMDGDPAYINDVFETDATAAITLLPAYLDKTREVDEPAYNRLIAQRIHGEHMAKEVQLRSKLEQIYHMVKEKDPASPALAILNDIAGWHDRLQKIAESEEDPRVKKLQDQIREGRKSEETTALKQRNEAYRSKAVTAVNKTAETILNSYLKGRKIEQEDRTTLMNYAVGIANGNINADAAFVKRRDEIAKTGNEAALLKFVSQRWDKELNIVIPKRVARLFGLGTATPTPEPAAGAPAAKAAAQPGFTKVAGPPEGKTVDWSRTTNDMVSKQHRCYVKGSKAGVYWELAG